MKVAPLMFLYPQMMDNAMPLWLREERELVDALMEYLALEQPKRCKHEVPLVFCP